MFGGSTMMMEATPGPTWLDERNRRKAVEADEVTRAFDAVEARRLDAELTRAFVANGVGRVEPIGAEDRARVAEIIAHDRLERETERRRGLAEVQARNGDFTNFAETVMPPTAEWLERAAVLDEDGTKLSGVRTFTPKQPDGTVRVIKTVRRLENSTITRLHQRGDLSDEQLWSCRWYRQVHERAGIEGRYKTSHLSLAGNVGGSGGGAQHPVAQHYGEAEARKFYREARSALTSFYLRFFEAVVIGDVPVRRAARFARCRESRALLRFRDAIGDLIDHLNRTGVEILPSRDRNDG